MYVKLKHLCRWTKTLASGEVKTYTYVRGTNEPLPGKEGSPEFMTAYYEAMKRRAKKAADQTTVHVAIHWTRRQDTQGLCALHQADRGRVRHHAAGGA